MIINRILNCATSKIFLYLSYQISVSVCTVQENLNFYDLFDKTIPETSLQNPFKTEDVNTLYKSIYRDNTARFFNIEDPKSHELKNEVHFGLDNTKIPSPQNSAFEDLIDTMCSETNTNNHESHESHESIRQDVYDFLSENKWYLHGGIGAFGVSAITFIVMVYRKWRQKKINSENGNSSSVEDQNSQDERLVVNTVENKQDEERPQADNSDDTILLISV
ncbi:uncharacterized protein LOC135134329 [Zophobas morio]|uniref:uncharacterized protein LOC135134329 n=1 Tax=Zophobas morio TaxID=2755281 RepID=UPI0030833356